MTVLKAQQAATAKCGELEHIPFNDRQKRENLKKKQIRIEKLIKDSDNYPKYVLMSNDFAGGNYEGIKTMNVADFLLSDEY